VRATFTPFGLMDKENVPPAWLAVRADDADDDGEKARVIAVPVGRDGECGETRRKSRTPSRPVLVDITRRFTPLENKLTPGKHILAGNSGVKKTTSGLHLFSVENVTMHGKRKLDKSTAATQGSRVSVKTMR